MASVAIVPSPSPRYHSSLHDETGETRSFWVRRLQVSANFFEPDRDVGVVLRRVRLAARLPDHARGETGIAGVVGDVRVGVRGVQLLRGRDVLVPCGRHGEAVLVEDALVVEQRHGTRVLRERVDAAVELDRAPRARGVLVLELVEAEVGEVDERVGQRELRQRVVLDLRDVGCARARLDGVLQLDVLVVPGAGVDHLDGDVRVLLLERRGDLLDGGRPCPHGDRRLLLEGGRDVVGVAGLRSAACCGCACREGDAEGEARADDGRGATEPAAPAVC
jgi:hypothetical protein